MVQLLPVSYTHLDVYKRQGRTCLNVSGSLTNALVVDKIMGTIDKDAYNNPNEGRV